MIHQFSTYDYMPCHTFIDRQIASISIFCLDIFFSTCLKITIWGYLFFAQSKIVINFSKLPFVSWQTLPVARCELVPKACRHNNKVETRRWRFPDRNSSRKIIHLVVFRRNSYIIHLRTCCWRYLLCTSKRKSYVTCSRVVKIRRNLTISA